MRSRCAGRRPATRLCRRLGALSLGQLATEPRAVSRRRLGRAPHTRRRPCAELGNAAGLFALQASAEQVGEQMVVTPPAAHLIQRCQEQALLNVLQHRLATRPAGDCIATRR